MVGARATAKPANRESKATNPLRAFARELDALRGGTSFRVLAAKAHVSYTALARAVRGDEVPTWTVTAAFLTACGIADPAVMDRWEAKLARVRTWRTNAQLDQLGLTSARQRRAARRAAGLTAVPDPACVVTAADLAEELRRLKRAAGNPSCREIAYRAGVPRATVGAMFSGGHFPSTYAYSPVVRVLVDQYIRRVGSGPRSSSGQHIVPAAEAWMDAYNRAAEHRYVLKTSQRKRPESVSS